MEIQYKELLDEAKKASENSYSPYSHFSVGACVLYESNKKYIGTNVENASYGLSLCAERSAISSAIANGEKTKIKALAIYSPKRKLCVPCGACRQWLSEFAKNDKMTIILEDKDSNIKTYTLNELLPYSFKIDE